MLREYERIQTAVPAMIQPMMKPYTDRVDEAMKPGLVALTWASMNVDTCTYLFLPYSMISVWVPLISHPLILMPGIVYM